MNFIKSFSWIYWDDHVIFIIFCDMVYHIDSFAYAEASLCVCLCVCVCVCV